MYIKYISFTLTALATHTNRCYQEWIRTALQSRLSGLQFDKLSLMAAVLTRWLPYPTLLLVAMQQQHSAVHFLHANNTRCCQPSM